MRRLKLNGTRTVMVKMELIRNILDKVKGKTQKKDNDMYYSYYLFGLSNGKPIWGWDNWQKCVPLLEPIIDLSPETPYIKTQQSVPVKYGKDSQFVSYDKGSLRFGKMIWSAENNEKWTTKYAKENQWTFFDTEIAFPTRSHCQKHGTNPDLLIIVHNENLTNTENAKVDQAIAIHIRTELIEQAKLSDIEKSIHQIGQLLNLRIGGKLKRQSSYKSDLGIGYTDSIWDGAYNILALGDEEFSENFKRYGIERIKL